MNKIIIIGNGFDKAHGLKTGYKDFIDNYWKEFAYNIFLNEILEDTEAPLVEFKVDRKKCNKVFSWPNHNENTTDNYESLKVYIESCNQERQKQCKLERKEGHDCKIALNIKCKNKFFQHISDPELQLNFWLDVENEYYDLLKKFLNNDTKEEVYKQYGWSSVEDLNKDFEEVKNQLEIYLTKITQDSELKQHPSITEAFNSSIVIDDVALSKQQLFNDYKSTYRNQIFIQLKNKPESFSYRNDQYIYDQIDDGINENGIIPGKILILNFNYTNTAERLYSASNYEVINIHGELNNKDNSIIFGYGDELDEDYKKLQQHRNNNFSKNFKSLLYTDNDYFGKILRFINDSPYQILIMGHSCGNSDRTLLNTLFDHKNCLSIKPYYYEWGNSKDDNNYSDMRANIAKNLTEQSIRDILVNKKRCQPLIPHNPE